MLLVTLGLIVAVPFSPNPACPNADPIELGALLKGLPVAAAEPKPDDPKEGAPNADVVEGALTLVGAVEPNAGAPNAEGFAAPAVLPKALIVVLLVLLVFAPN